MSPQRQLVLSVLVIAVIVAAAWFALFRRHILAPPIVPAKGPSLSEIANELDRQARTFDTLVTPTASSDDTRDAQSPATLGEALETMLPLAPPAASGE